MLRKSKYSPEFKREAVKLAHSSDKKLSVIADELGVCYKTLCNWTREAVKKPDTPTKKQHHYQELLAENAKLKRELKRAQQEREILKKAAAFFAAQET